MQIGIGIGIPGGAQGSAAAAAFTPTSLSGCVMWLRADMGVTLGTGVSAWADQSGSGNHVAQGTGANQPAYSATTGPGGTRPGITFDGSNDCFDANSMAAMFNGTNVAFTMIVSAKMASDTVTRTLISVGSSTVNGRKIRMSPVVSAGTKLLILKQDDAAVSVSHNLNSPVTDDNTWRGLQAICAGATVKLRNNNTLTSAAAFSNGAITLDLFGIGKTVQAAPFQFFSGVLWEVIIYNRALTDAESDQIRAYQITYEAAA